MEQKNCVSFFLLKFSKLKSTSLPVLSKQVQSTAPATLMVRGEMQKMLRGSSRRLASTVPMVMAAGSAGGTTMVTRSTLSNRMS